MDLAPNICTLIRHVRSRAKRTRAVPRAVSSIEFLSPRILLAAALENVILTVDGTPGDDVVIVAANKRFVNVLTVFVNDEPSHFSLSALNSIRVATGDGDDKIWIDSSLDPMRYASTIDAGSGNDSVTTGEGADSVTAGAGDDKVYTNGGRDLLDGGTGRDLLVGGYDYDTIVGGAHNDRILGQHGNDVIYPGKGDDFVDAGSTEYGSNTIVDSAGTETIFGGPEYDYVEFQNGTVWGGDGHDDLVALGVASVYGMGGNDKLYGTFCDGGNGDDTLTGTSRADQLHAGAHNDLVKGNGGADFITGGDGNDALFGGSDTDTIHAGAGDDNLYCSDGHRDKNHADDGNDIAYGEAGYDWWEPEVSWGDTDASRADRKPTEQNILAQDPSSGYYGGGDMTTGLVTSTYTYWSTPTIGIATKSLGPAGWLSSGAYDPAQQKFVPPPMARQDRLAVGRMVVQLPAAWQLGAMSFARDEIVWYRVSGEPVAPPSYGAYASPNGPLSIPWEWMSNSSTAVPALAGGWVEVANTSDGLLDGVNAGTHRFLGVKRGTVIISGAGSTVADVAQHYVTVTLLPTKSTQKIRLAGYDRVFTPADDVIDALPTGGPKVRGILVDGGAIWLPTDGTEPYFSSGNK